MTLLDENFEDNKLIIRGNNSEIIAKYPKEQIDTIKRHIAKGATDEDLFYFLQVAAINGYNPFLTPSHIWFYLVNEKDPFTKKQTGKKIPVIFPSVEGLVHKVRQLPDYQYIRAETVYENDDYFVTRKNGIPEVTHRSDTFSDKGKIKGAYAIVKFAGLPEFFAEVDFEKSTNKNNETFWKSYPVQMIEKCAKGKVAKMALDAKNVNPIEVQNEHFKIGEDELLKDSEEESFINAEYSVKKEEPEKFKKDYTKIFANKIKADIEKTGFRETEDLILKKIERYENDVNFSKFEVLDRLGYAELSNQLREREIEKFTTDFYSMDLRSTIEGANTTFIIKTGKKAVIVKDEKQFSEIGRTIDLDETVENELKLQGLEPLTDENILKNVLENIKKYKEKNKEKESLALKESEEKEEEYKKKAEKQKAEAEERRRKKRESKKIKEGNFSENKKEREVESVISPEEAKDPLFIYNKAVARLSLKKHKISKTNVKFKANEILKEAGIKPSETFIKEIGNLFDEKEGKIY